MTYKTNKYRHFAGSVKAHAYRMQRKALRRPRNTLPNSQRRLREKRRWAVESRKKVDDKLVRGVLRLGDQWAPGKQTYRKIRPSISEEYIGRWLAIAQGGIDLVGHEDESREAFERRVAELVKPHENYTPYILQHKPIITPGEDDGDDDDEEEDEEEEGEDEEGEEEEGVEDVDEDKDYETPDEAAGESASRGRKLPKEWVDVD